MDFISTREAAKKWKVTVRCVQKFLADGRIAGAKRLGRSWAIPSEAEKPSDQRNKGNDGSILQCPKVPYLSCFIPLPKGNADLAVRSLENEGERRQLRAEFARLRGDDDTAQRLCRNVPSGSPMKICASVIQAETAIDTGNYPLYVRANSYLQGVRGTENESTAQMALLTIRVNMLMTDGERKLTTEACSALPVEMRPLMIYMHLKSLEARLEYQRLVDVSETALALILRKDTFLVLEVYIFLLCAVGHLGMNEIDEARRYISRAMELALPDGFIMPFVEFLVVCQGLIEQCLDLNYPEMKERILCRWDEVWESWILFRNSYINGEGMEMMTLREYQIAIAIANGLTYEETADRFDLSLGRIRNLTSAIYGKMNVRNRSELRNLMLHGSTNKLKDIEAVVQSAFKSQEDEKDC